jgi:hypothetical protein
MLDVSAFNIGLVRFEHIIDEHGHILRVVNRDDRRIKAFFPDEHMDRVEVVGSTLPRAVAKLGAYLRGLGFTGRLRRISERMVRSKIRTKFRW